jgi:hypothetical protein
LNDGARFVDRKQFEGWLAFSGKPTLVSYPEKLTDRLGRFFLLFRDGDRVPHRPYRRARRRVQAGVLGVQRRPRLVQRFAHIIILASQPGTWRNCVTTCLIMKHSKACFFRTA